MLKNNIKVAWRLMLRNKVLSFINIFGLSIGLAFAILIGMWISYETSFDKFHKNLDRLAFIYKHTFFNNEKNTQNSTPLALYYELKSNYPEIKRITRLSWNNDYSVAVGDRKLKGNGKYVDPEFFDMFSFPIVKGNARAALSDLHTIIITESLAGSLFGDQDPINQTVRINNQVDVKVGAVMKDVPSNSSFQFDFVGPFEYLVETIPFFAENKSNWGNNFLMNAVELQDGVSMEAFSKKIEHLNTEKDKSLKDLFLFLQPVSKWRLQDEFRNWVNTGGNYAYVRLFGIIGAFVLLIACINFMNLSTARSEKRAREVGIRKAVGSSRRQLIYQFLSETLLTAFFAFIVGILIIPLVLPLLSDIGFENVQFDLLDIRLFGSILAVALITGLVAGSYPALYLSSFRPVRVLKGLFKQGQGTVAFRKILVISQFAISVGLIISTVIVFRQIEHGRERSLGYNPDRLVNIESSDDLMKNFDVLRNELLRTGYVESIAKVSSPLTNVYNSWSDFSWEGKDPQAQQVLDVIMTEWDFEKTVGLSVIEGRAFSRDHKSDSNAVLLNEAGLKMIGYKNPIGRTMHVGETPLTIVGIVKDMIIQNPFQPVNPTIIMFSPQSATNNIYLKFKENASLQAALAAIQPIFEKHNPSYPFEFQFSDDQFETKFRMEKQIGKLAAIFAGLAIFISCLGLFGLAAFMAERRTKEIGIRKVLGASLLQLWTLLSKEFVWLVLIGCAIATPIAYWMMHSWLKNYDYRIDINWFIFIISTVIALIIALMTVSTQAVKAALSNPVKSLRSE